MPATTITTSAVAQAINMVVSAGTVTACNVIVSLKFTDANGKLSTLGKTDTFDVWPTTLSAQQKTNLQSIATSLIALLQTKYFTITPATVLPATLNIAWDPPSPSDNVTNYILQLDANTPVNVPPTVDVPSNSIKASMTISTPGAHTITLQAQNAFSASTPTVLNFTVTTPSSPANVQVNIT
jgi:hypothetical protein